MVGPQLGRETDAIAESAYKIKRRLCVTTLHVILKSGRLEKWSGQSRTSRTGGAAPVTSEKEGLVSPRCLPADNFFPTDDCFFLDPSMVLDMSLALG